ncbi:hypothetical protein ACSNOK_19795 [Streptomyces sp. URMC 126]|uniref:hypothetical protein n=1 Tax=Streptomyces sp. URMC 126 TaxID=3423401 RepID=UPI003F1BC854
MNDTNRPALRTLQDVVRLEDAKRQEAAEIRAQAERALQEARQREREADARALAARNALDKGRRLFAGPGPVPPQRTPPEGSADGGGAGAAGGSRRRRGPTVREAVLGALAGGEEVQLASIYVSVGRTRPGTLDSRVRSELVKLVAQKRVANTGRPRQGLYRLVPETDPVGE